TDDHYASIAWRYIYTKLLPRAHAMEP
ncbi:hypothetical protein BVRB_019720, partial [Beta vulgaris subsp. vulgaris]